MALKILHIVGGEYTNGASKGAHILHNALLDLGVNSHILNDVENFNPSLYKNTTNIKSTLIKKLLSKLFILIEKILKFLFLHRPRETFTISFFGHDITKTMEYKNADIIHIHWLSQGFLSLKSLSKIKKPVVWTMRDMWAFTGGSHYIMDFENYEKGKISKLIQNYKKKNYNINFNFVAVSDWLKVKAEKSFVLDKFKVSRIYNNIDVKNFKNISKEESKKSLNIETDKNIILYGANNPQSNRKGWNIFNKALEKIDKSKYFLLIFGNFWSQSALDKIGIEYKSLGFINDEKKLNLIYSCSDFFIASSIQDAWPKTFAEAMCCGKPVICFANTSISEIVDHKINGYVVENFDPSKLAEGIEWVAKGVKENIFQIDKTKKKILEFNSVEIAKKYVKFYNQISS